MSGCGGIGCDSIGTGVDTPDTFAVSMVNIGGQAEWYAIGTGPNPFELRTAFSSDGSVGINQLAQTIDFTVDAADLVSMTNVGGGAQSYVVGSGPDPFEIRSILSPDNSVGVTQTATEIELTTTLGNIGGEAEVWDSTSINPFNLRSIYSSDSSVNVTQEATRINLQVDQGAGAEVFQVDDDVSTLSTSSTTYQTLTTLATDPRNQVKNGEEWKINICLEICHPLNVFTINTLVRWAIETAPAVFTQIDEWQVNTGIQINVGEPSIPYHRTRNVDIVFDDPRMLVQARMTVNNPATPTFVERPRWGGVQIAPAP